jgi:hypothetical protein
VRRPHASKQYNIRMKQRLWSALHMILELLFSYINDMFETHKALHCPYCEPTDTFIIMTYAIGASQSAANTRWWYWKKEPLLAGHCFSVAYESERVAGILYFIHFTTEHHNNVILTSIKNAFLLLVAGRSSTFCLVHLDSLYSGLGLPYLTHSKRNTNDKLQCIYWMYRKRLF